MDVIRGFLIPTLKHFAHLLATSLKAPRVTLCRSNFSVSVISIVLDFSVREEWPSFESVKQRDFYSRHSSQESLWRHCLLLVHNLSQWRQTTLSQAKSELDSGALARLRLFHTQHMSTTARKTRHRMHVPTPHRNNRIPPQGAKRQLRDQQGTPWVGSYCASVTKEEHWAT